MSQVTNQNPEQDPQPDPVFTLHMAAMREMQEPRDGIAPTPVSYIIMCLLFVLGGGWYLGYYGGEWTANGLSERPIAGIPPAPPPQDPMVLGKEVFGACLQCHQESGLGVAGTYPPLAGSEYVLGDKRRLVAILLKGLNGEFVVKGNTYNSQMPAWEIREDEEIAAVLTYIRNSWGNKADAVSKDLVTAVRKETAGRGEWRAATLAEFAK
ncbi:MAG: cytochrome c [Bryobacteraceae bacterium]|nr:cytochrome c [Bryobacteraceae bacterium]